MNQVMFGVIITRFSFLVSAATTIVFTCIVNLIMNYKVKKIDLLNAMKCVE